MWDVNVELVFVLQGIIFGNTATLLQTHTISTVIHGSFFFFFFVCQDRGQAKGFGPRCWLKIVRLLLVKVMISNQSNEQKKDIKKKKNLKKRREEEEAKMGVNNGVVIVIVDNFAFVRHLG